MPRAMISSQHFALDDYDIEPYVRYRPRPALAWHSLLTSHKYIPNLTALSYGLPTSTGPKPSAHWLAVRLSTVPPVSQGEQDPHSGAVPWQSVKGVVQTLRIPYNLRLLHDLALPSEYPSGALGARVLSNTGRHAPQSTGVGEQASCLEVPVGNFQGGDNSCKT